MAKDKDNMASLYETIIEEQMTPLAVQSSATSDGEAGGLTPDELPADAASTTEVQKGTGAENAKDVDAPEEAEEKLSPVSKNKGTEKTAKKKTVTESDVPKKSFMDLFDQVMVKEAEGDEGIESAGYDDAAGDFPETEGEVPVEGEELGEGEIYAQLSDLFGQLAEVKGFAGAVEDEVEGDMGEEYGEEGAVPESVEEPIGEAKSEPEPKEFSGNTTERQLPTKLAGKGVEKKAPKKAAVKGNDKKRTGELEDGPEGFKHDKSKFAVRGDGPIHTPRKGSDPSFVEAS
jgi:hypothetical protein